MPDREKVIKALECCCVKPSPKCEACLYADEVDGTCFTMDKMLSDALALLKAQEPVKPTIDIRHGKSMWRCGSCSTALQPNQMHAKFCFNCGKAVKWE